MRSLPAFRSRSAAARCAAAALVASAGAASAAAQVNVRGWSANGQVHIVWERTAASAFPTETYEVYASATPQATIATMTRVGRLFEPEYTGRRLTRLQAGARLTVPTGGGGAYTLLNTEGAFAFTPRASGSLLFAVVKTGSAAVGAANSTTIAFVYDPVNNPVVPQAQFGGVSIGGNPYTAYVVWALGSDVLTNGRPDFPVMADADKNGVPHVFTITYPIAPLPATPASCVLALHGGGGEYELFRPGMPARGNLQLYLEDGVVVTPDDAVFYNESGVLEVTDTFWFGYASAFDPFDGGARLPLPSQSVVANVTQRRVHWIIDWLLSPRAPVVVDADRVSMIGHSGGGRGASHISRLRPERFAAVVVHTPASDLTLEPLGRQNYLQGNWSENLPTSIVLPGQAPVGVTDVFTMTTRLSPARDFAFTRFYFGKRDQDSAATWSAAQRAVVDGLDTGAGYAIFWDEREHGVEKWGNETDDMFDGNPDPWPDVAQWISPVRSGKAAAQHLVDAHRAARSYPGFFNADQDPVLAGRQPDPGSGDPSLGDPWGTWGGYLEWDPLTIIDGSARWHITLFGTGLSTTLVDNAPVELFTTDLSPRKTVLFDPPQGSPAHWVSRDVLTGDDLQSGAATIGPDGLATVLGLEVPRDPARVRLTVGRGCNPADVDFSGVLDLVDFFTFLNDFDASDEAADLNGDGSVDLTDFFLFLNTWDSGC